MFMTLKEITYTPLLFFFFNDTATTEIYTLSLHDALPICTGKSSRKKSLPAARPRACWSRASTPRRSEEHTSELQSPCNLVCRLLLEKKKNKKQVHAVSYHMNDGALAIVIE